MNSFCVFERRKLIFSLRRTSKYDALCPNIDSSAQKRKSFCSMDYEICI